MARPKNPQTAAEKKEAEARAAAKVEEARDRWLDKGANRVDAALKSIRNVGKMGQSPNYGWTEDEVAYAFDALADELNRARQQFRPRTGTKETVPGFAFGQTAS